MPDTSPEASAGPAPTPLWTPDPERADRAAMTRFRRAAAAELGRELPDYDALHAWSVGDPNAFWRFYARWSGLPIRGIPERVLSDDPMPETRWFEGATVNYAEALLFPRGLEDADAPAILSTIEGGDRRAVSWRELRDDVARARAALVRSGVGRGDRVAALAANTPESVVLLLACASLGAVFASASPDFGADAATARLGQIEPSLIFATPAYRYGGKRFETRETVRALAAACGDVEVVLLPYPGIDAPRAIEGVRTTSWGAWTAADDAAPALAFADLPFDHPLYVLFSSGTTGLPKAIVHRAGGALLTHAKEQQLHGDIRPGDRVFYFTTCGWMMWNWLVGALAQAATIVLYDGNPGWPDLGALWRMADATETTFFGTSARFLHALDAAGVEPHDEADLRRLRTVASTGSPLSPAGFRYVYDKVAADVHLASISGGTDIVSCFMLGVPTLPVYAGEIQRPGLGVDLAVYDDGGRPVEGEPGELVCRQPLPCMPLRFWNDPEGQRYRAAYFSDFEGVWRHGDLIERTPTGGIVVYGRSDATLNPGGVRIGTAEIYRPLEHVGAVVEAAAVGRREDGDESIWLLVVLREGRALDEALEAEIRSTIRSAASPRHVPARILAVPALPRTRSGKITEIAVAKLVNGREVPNRSVMANPEALDGIAEALAREGIAPE